MIAISKAEKDVISEKFPNVYIVRTVKQKSKRHHYYCEESKAVMRFLKRARSIGGITNALREGDSYTGRKKTR